MDFMLSVTTDKLKKMYTDSTESVRRQGMTMGHARGEYKNYVDYITHHVSLHDKKVLDVGCGNGWSSYLLAEKASQVTAMDVHHNGFEPEVTHKLSYVSCSATNIILPNASVDVVTTNECIEHIPHPAQVLAEFDRVLKPGGYVFVVGPNLFSVLQSVRGLSTYVWKVRPIKNIFVRAQGMPRHPHGNTLPEIVAHLFLNLWAIFKLYAFKKPLFQLREPDVKPPFFADNDACYFLNPLDLKYYFSAKGYEVIDYAGLKRSPATAMIPSGTWFVARKKKS